MHQFYKQRSQGWVKRIAHLFKYVVDKYGRQHAGTVGPIPYAQKGKHIGKVHPEGNRKARRNHKRLWRQLVREAIRRGRLVKDRTIEEDIKAEIARRQGKVAS